MLHMKEFEQTIFLAKFSRVQAVRLEIHVEKPIGQRQQEDNGLI